MMSMPCTSNVCSLYQSGASARFGGKNSPHRCGICGGSFSSRLHRPIRRLGQMQAADDDRTERRLGPSLFRWSLGPSTNLPFSSIVCGWRGSSVEIRILAAISFSAQLQGRKGRALATPQHRPHARHGCVDGVPSGAAGVPLSDYTVRYSTVPHRRTAPHSAASASDSIFGRSRGAARTLFKIYSVLRDQTCHIAYHHQRSRLSRRPFGIGHQAHPL